MSEQFLETNYLSPENLVKLVLALPKIPYFTSEYNKLKMDIYDFEALYKICYYCALRITEALDLQVEYFDLEHRILKLPKTKTGFEPCKVCSENEYLIYKQVNRQRRIVGSKNKECEKCFGKGKARITQKTSINPVIIEELKDYLKDKTGPLFKCSRVTAWKYAKLAGELAGLKVFEEQKKRSIEGVWTHLFRKSYAKLMELKGATPSLIMLKGRWSPREMYQTYTKPSLNALIEWEARNFG